jgi:hypothetical protein
MVDEGLTKGTRRVHEVNSLSTLAACGFEIPLTMRR